MMQSLLPPVVDQQQRSLTKLMQQMEYTSQLDRNKRLKWHHNKKNMALIIAREGKENLLNLPDIVIRKGRDQFWKEEPICKTEPFFDAITLTRRLLPLRAIDPTPNFKAGKRHVVAFDQLADWRILDRCFQQYNDIMDKSSGVRRRKLLAKPKASHISLPVNISSRMHTQDISPSDRRYDGSKQILTYRVYSQQNSVTGQPCSMNSELKIEKYQNDHSRKVLARPGRNKSMLARVQDLP